MKFRVPEMSCGHCTAAITRQIKSFDPNASVTANLEARTLEVTTGQPTEGVLNAIKAAGYDAAPA